MESPVKTLDALVIKKPNKINKVRTLRVKMEKMIRSFSNHKLTRDDLLKSLSMDSKPQFERVLLVL